MKSWARFGFLAVSWLLVVGVVLQAFLAGLALFAGSSWWASHVNYGYLVSLGLGTLLILLTFASRLPSGMHRLSVLLGVLAILQPGFIYPGRFVGAPVEALHPVNALILFWLGLRVARRAREFVPAPLGTGGRISNDEEN